MSSAPATHAHSDSTQLREQLIAAIDIVKDGTALIPVAGQYIGPALGVVKGLLDLVGSFKGNKEELPKLKEQIENITKLSLNGIEGDLRNRLEHLQR
ncbi:WD-REPEATS-REGION domain-containing protein [Mycena chlorophos]|uniref:WD-REPEATS-REGION domain-containing protein n=1 Tax=Mycena chlorophos TaxID=658473 RepID=A0A8H6WAK5_MYCCL|nr:WD-REPEATS-REGION domain-containing protein [Mycena chlorophos]